ncbi:MAG: hypothetical protein ACREQR_13525 [Candidatus Binataceae bacterium]
MPGTIFSWGYWGWGNATEQLVRGIDAAERDRGYAPPIFVDIRIRRTGRAKGFVGDAFREMVGEKRYRWMKDLGNNAIAAGESGIRIKNSEAAADLLQVALDAAADNRRVLFYCACEYPWYEGHRWCHRDTVSHLLLEEARKRSLAVAIVEWPGGDPVEQTVEIGPKMFSSVMRGRKSIPLDQPVKLDDVAGLPWASIAKLESNGDTGYVMVGPARYMKSTADGSGWYLPVLEPAERDATPKLLQQHARRWRKERGLEPRES